MNTITKPRIESIDILRGIVMIIMALDHVRDYFHVSANTEDPLDLGTTTPLLFFTRWITHFCAPIFVFLSGTSAYLQGNRKSKSELSSFLITRGLWLIVVEVVIISFGWSFNPFYNFLFIQVIWAIGISMVILGCVIHLPYKAILVIGLVIVFGHNLLDIPEAMSGYQVTFLKDLLHHGHFSPYEFAPNHTMLIVYPFLPWAGLMILGYCFGKIYTGESGADRKKKLRIAGLGLILLFVVLRCLNAYGDPVQWQHQRTGFYTFLSFIDVHKYPPSLLFLCVTIGPALIALSFLESIRNKFTDFLKTYGRVALFYYIIHLYLIHLLSSIAFFMRGHNMQDAFEKDAFFPFYFQVPGEGYSLGIVYLVWISVILILYPLCRKYDRYKTNHREKVWLSYL